MDSANHNNADMTSSPGNNGTGNGSSATTHFCTDNIPTTAQLFNTMPIEGKFLFAILVLFSLLTLFVYVKEIKFIRRHFKHGTRIMWVLACYPVFSWSALLAVAIPRSGVIIDMIANGYFATCLYNFGRLMVRYVGGTSRLWRIFDGGRIVTFNTLPVCCCCFCLPKPPFQMSVYNLMRTMVMQVTIIRPILAFIAVILYVDGTFKPGSMAARNPYTYIAVGDGVSTITAVYGLMLLRNTFRPELEQHFKITGKIMSVQLALISSVLPNIIVGILVSTNVIKCGPVFPSKARGEAIYHTVLVLIMLPLSLMAQTFFKRASDAESYLDRKLTSPVANGKADGSDASQAEEDGSGDWSKGLEIKVGIPDHPVVTSPPPTTEIRDDCNSQSADDAAANPAADWPLRIDETKI